MRINGRLFRALVGGGWILFLLLVPGIVQSQGGRLDDDPARLVRLQTADVILRSGVYDTAGNRHVVLQLGHNLKRAEIDSLSAAGVRLVSYLGDGAFIAGVDPNALTADICGVYDIEAAAPWRAENKATPKLRQGVAPDWALSEGGLLKLSVLFFEDVARSEIESILGRHAASYASQHPPLLWAIEIEPSKVPALLQEQGIYAVEPGPIPFQPLLDESRALIHVDEVQQPSIGTDPPSIEYHGLTGKGIMLQVSESVWDGHPDFQDANGKTRFDNPSPDSGGSHGTSVASIMGGNGVHSASLQNTPFYAEIGRWRGMAPEVSLFQGKYYGSQRLIDASNHSFVMDYGTYDSTSASVDRQIRGDSGPALQWPQVWAAANNGLFAMYDNEEGYYSMYAPAKNSIAVGCVNANDGSLSTFVSSLGPTFDGRIKPDVMAPGSKYHFPPEFDLYQDKIQVMFDYIRVYNTRTGSLDAGWEFSQDGDPEGWFQTYGVCQIYDVNVAGGYLTFQIGFRALDECGMLAWGWNNQVSVRTDPDHEMVIRYKMSTPAGSTAAGGKLLWHWVDNTSAPADGEGEIPFRSLANDSWVVEAIPVGKWGQTKNGHIGAWKGSIDRVGLIPLAHNWPGILSAVRSTIDNPPRDFYAYGYSQGTSEAAPAVTGSVALILQQYRERLGIDVRNDPPLPSTIKAILVQTVEDLVHTSGDPRDPDNPDTQTPVLYYEGPDFATGYGLVNIKAAVDLVGADPGPGAVSRFIHEGEIDAYERDTYEMLLTNADIARLGDELKLTLAWDDPAGSPATQQTAPKLVNDLDLYLVDPDGTTHLPWTLDPPPVASCGGDGPGCGDPDPISSDDIVPAKRATDHRNNVEMVQVSQPKPGRWLVVVDAYNVPLSVQKYSLVGNQLTTAPTSSIMLPLIISDR
jgi:hypothetical protein